MKTHFKTGKWSLCGLLKAEFSKNPSCSICKRIDKATEDPYHPSGQAQPSPEDIKVTGKLVESGKIIGIPVLDHMVITKRDYFSFVEGGLM